ncbi:hypothetical protein [Luethyella okanaganae]|uniref:Uncharacterized protein n=1 Tax=Luethyella okanaganae TaxID=69372 RepID=A0ABW1VGE5_9MICO
MHDGALLGWAENIASAAEVTAHSHVADGWPRAELGVIVEGAL